MVVVCKQSQKVSKAIEKDQYTLIEQSVNYARHYITVVKYSSVIIIKSFH